MRRRCELVPLNSDTMRNSPNRESPQQHRKTTSSLETCMLARVTMRCPFAPVGKSPAVTNDAWSRNSACHKQGETMWHRRRRIFGDASRQPHAFGKPIERVNIYQEPTLAQTAGARLLMPPRKPRDYEVLRNCCGDSDLGKFCVASPMAPPPAAPSPPTRARWRRASTLAQRWPQPRGGVASTHVGVCTTQYTQGQYNTNAVL